MFDMSVAQQKAFTHGSGGIPASDFTHFILFLIALASLVWLSVYLIGVWTRVNARQCDVGDALFDTAVGVCLLAAIAALII